MDLKDEKKVNAEILTQIKTKTLPKKYLHRTIKKRIEAFFLDNIGIVVTREQLIEIAKDPNTGKEPENWHQRLSELRTDDGYTILSHRDTKKLNIEEYLMPTAEKRPIADKRVKPNPKTWATILERSKNMCEWSDDGQLCKLKNREIDPIGGGTVKLTPDHLTPHSINPKTDPDDPKKWRALCGRHQVMKKNFWDNDTGRINYTAIIQAASEKDKWEVYELLETYFSKKIS
jgi:hypothetical protein